MTYTSTITSKGTVTIPAEIRKQLGLKPGGQVSFSDITPDKTVVIQPALTWKELQNKNQAILKRNGHWPPKPYKSGSGFEAHVAEKYGKKSID